MESHVPWAAPLLRPRGRGHLCHSRWPSLSLTLCPQFLGVQPRDLRQHQDGASYHRPGALLARPHGDLRTSGRDGLGRCPLSPSAPNPHPVHGGGAARASPAGLPIPLHSQHTVAPHFPQTTFACAPFSSLSSKPSRPGGHFSWLHIDPSDQHMYNKCL